MKKIIGLVVLIALFTACSDDKGRYVDLRTGETISVEKDPQSGAWINTETKQPVYIYVDTKNNDTIYGRTGAVINSRVVRSNDVWYFDEDVKLSTDADAGSSQSDGDYKRKVEGDGDVKIKDGDTKIKID